MSAKIRLFVESSKISWINLTGILETECSKSLTVVSDLQEELRWVMDEED